MTTSLTFLSVLSGSKRGARSIRDKKCELQLLREAQDICEILSRGPHTVLFFQKLSEHLHSQADKNGKRSYLMLHDPAFFAF